MEIMPVEMFEKVFEFCSPNDLASMSHTCRFFKLWAGDYFKLKFKNCGKFTISMADFHFESGEFERFEVIFRSLIRNIQVDIEKPSEIASAFWFIRENCADRLRQLSLYGPYKAEVTINGDQMQILTEQIANLEILIMYGCLIDDEALSQRLRNLRILCIENFPIDASGSWMNQSFANLHTFWLLRAEGEMYLTNFLRINPQISFVFTNNLAAIRSVLLIDRELSKAAIRFWQRNDFQEVLPEYRECCARRNITSLDVSFHFFISTENLREIVRLKYVKSLHYQLNDIIMPYFNEMDVQPNVEQLCLRVESCYSEAELNTIIRCFPNLIELRLDFEHGSLLLSMVDNVFHIIKVLIRQLGYLEHLYIVPDNVITAEQANNLNFNRLELGNASKVTIHFSNNDLSDEMKLNVTLDAVAFEFEEQNDCPICNAKGKGHTELCLKRLDLSA